MNEKGLCEVHWVTVEGFRKSNNHVKMEGFAPTRVSRRQKWKMRASRVSDPAFLESIAMPTPKYFLSVVERLIFSNN